MADAGFLIERPDRARPSERRGSVSPIALSLLLHLGLLAVLVLVGRVRAPAPHWLPPPAMKMEFTGGGKGKTSVPNHAPAALHRPASPPPAAISAPRQAPAAPARPASPRRPAPVPAPMPRSAPPSAAPTPARPSPVSPPGSHSAPPPVPAARLALPPPRPAAPPRPETTTPAPPRLRFPAPMRFSLGGAPQAGARAAPARRAGRGIALSFAPRGAGSKRFSIDGLLDRDGVGPDWSNAFSAWLARHSYYPHDAGEMGEHGDVVVNFVVAKDGTVSKLRLVASSGYPLLDMATLSMLRNAHLPPLPPQNGARLPVRFTMRYVIIR